MPENIAGTCLDLCYLVKLITAACLAQLVECQSVVREVEGREFEPQTGPTLGVFAAFVIISTNG